MIKFMQGTLVLLISILSFCAFAEEVATDTDSEICSCSCTELGLPENPSVGDVINSQTIEELNDIAVLKPTVIALPGAETLEGCDVIKDFCDAAICTAELVLSDTVTDSSSNSSRLGS